MFDLNCINKLNERDLKPVEGLIKSECPIEVFKTALEGTSLDSGNKPTVFTRTEPSKNLNSTIEFLSQPEDITDESLQDYIESRSSLQPLIKALGNKSLQTSSPKLKILYFNRIKKLIAAEKKYLSQHPPTYKERLNKVLEKLFFPSDVKMLISICDSLFPSSWVKAEKTFNQLLLSPSTENWTLLHYAAHTNNKELVAECLLSNETHINTQDYNQQTALHIACQKGNISVVAFLIQNKADLSCVDKNSMKPLELLPKNVLDSLLNLLSLKDAHSKGIGSSSLEIACILQNRNLLWKVRNELGDDRFNQLREELKSKYSSNSLNILYDFKYDVELKASLIEGAEENNISYPQQEVQLHLNKLIAMCEEINFSDPTQADYYDPNKLSDDGRKISTEMLQGSMQKFAANVGQRKKLNAMEQFTKKEFDSFFDELQRSSVDVVKKLEAMDKRDRTGILIDIAISANHCAARHMAIIKSLQENLGGQFLDVKQQTQQFQRKLKIGILEQLSGSSPHRYNAMMELIGEEIGLFRENFIFDRLSSVTKESCRSSFFKQFTTTFFINSAYTMINNSKEMSRDLIVDWFKDNVPDNWRKEESESLHEEITKMRNSNTSRADMVEFLQDKDISVVTTRHATVEEALEKLSTPQKTEAEERARQYILALLQRPDLPPSLDLLWGNMQPDLVQMCSEKKENAQFRLLAIRLLGKVSRQTYSDEEFYNLLPQVINNQRKQSYLEDFVYEKFSKTKEFTGNIDRQAIIAMLHQLGQLKEGSASKMTERADLSTISEKQESISSSAILAALNQELVADQIVQNEVKSLIDPPTKTRPTSFVGHIKHWFSYVRDALSSTQFWLTLIKKIGFQPRT